MGLIALGAFIAFPSRVAGIALVAAGVLWLVTTHERTRKWIPLEWKGFGNPHGCGLDKSYIADRTIRIVDLLQGGQTQVRGKTFERCHFVGPAVGFSPTCQVLSPTLDTAGDEETLFWEVEPNRFYLGAVGFDECTLRDCRFSSCGLAATKETIAHLKETAQTRL